MLIAKIPAVDSKILITSYPEFKSDLWGIKGLLGSGYI